MNEKTVTREQITNADTLAAKLATLPKEDQGNVSRELNAYLEGYLTARRVFCA